MKTPRRRNAKDPPAELAKRMSRRWRVGCRGLSPRRMVPPIHTSLTVPDEKDCDMPKPVPPVKFAIADPDAIQETLCDGPFNVSATAGRATITFTHVRPKIEPLFTAGEVQPEAIVRARISFSWQNLLSLKKLLNDLIPDAPSDKPVAGSGGGATMH
jgi:hypothetical protein